MSIENPNASVIGGIQPALLHELLSDGKGDSGFSARILFAYPDETHAPHDREMIPDTSVYDNWEKIVKWIHKLPDRIMLPKNVKQKPIVEDAVTIDCTDEAKSVYKAYFNKLADHINAADDDRIKSMLGKMQAYCMRFALIIEMMDRACQYADLDSVTAPPSTNPNDVWDTPSVVGESKTFARWEDVEKEIQITGASMRAARVLTDYFIETGRKVLSRLETPVESLRPEQQAWYKALPVGEAFRFVTAKESAEKVKLPPATFKRLLNRQDLFSRRKATIANKEVEMYLRKWI
jgi:hypothetical protein